MADSSSIFIAALAGFVSAFVFSSIPVGPVNLAIINEGARRGFLWAMLIGLGAAAMEVSYCAIAFAGFSSFFEIGISSRPMMKVFTLRFSFVSGNKISRGKKSRRHDTIRFQSGTT